MPEWVHARANHLLKKNPSMPESEAWAIATKQFKKQGSDRVQKKIEFQGIEIHIDRPKGFEQKFKDGNVRKYLTDYGFFPGTKARDGEDLDVYVGDDKNASFAYVIKQMINGKEDEKKVMLGFPSESSAKEMFLAHFTKDMRNSVVGGIEKIPMQEFKKSLGTSKFASEKKKERNDLKLLAATSGGIAAPVAAEVLGSTLDNTQELAGDKQLLKKLETSTDTPISRGSIRAKSFDEFSKHPLFGKLDKEVREGAYNKALENIGGKMRSDNSYYIPDSAILKRQIVVGNTHNAPALLAHEIGHSQLDDFLPTKALQTAYQFTPTPGFTGGAALGALSGLSDNETIRDLGKYGPAALSIPMLAVEAGASLKGYRNMKNLGATPEQLAAARKQLLTAWGTYATKPTGAALGSYVGQETVDRLRGDSEKSASLNKFNSFMDELVKLGEISEQEARDALDRYEFAVRNRMPTDQVMRMAAIGAVASPIISLSSNLMKGKSPLGDNKVRFAKTREVLTNMAHGALTGGGLASVRQSVEEKAQKEKILEFLKEKEKQVPPQTLPPIVEHPFVPPNYPPDVMHKLEEETPKAEKSAGAALTPGGLAAKAKSAGRTPGFAGKGSGIAHAMGMNPSTVSSRMVPGNTNTASPKV